MNMATNLQDISRQWMQLQTRSLLKWRIQKRPFSYGIQVLHGKGKVNRIQQSYPIIRCFHLLWRYKNRLLKSRRDCFTRDARQWIIVPKNRSEKSESKYCSIMTYSERHDWEIKTLEYRLGCSCSAIALITTDSTRALSEETSNQRNSWDQLVPTA